jgi:hypothetical protein
MCGVAWLSSSHAAKNHARHAVRCCLCCRVEIKYGTDCIRAETRVASTALFWMQSNMHVLWHSGQNECNRLHRVAAVTLHSDDSRGTVYVWWWVKACIGWSSSHMWWWFTSCTHLPQWPPSRVDGCLVNILCLKPIGDEVGYVYSAVATNFQLESIVLRQVVVSLAEERRLLPREAMPAGSERVKA